MVVHKCNKESEINKLLTLSTVNKEKISAIHEDLNRLTKALMGNGHEGYFAQFEQFKGGMKMVKIVLITTILVNLGLLIKAFI